MRRHTDTEQSTLGHLTADVVRRVRAVSAAYRSAPTHDLEAAARRLVEALLDAAAGGPPVALDAVAEQRIALRAEQGFPPGDLLALLDAAEAALADTLEEPAGRAALGDPSWPGVLMALDRLRSALLARLGLFESALVDARVHRLAHERRLAA